MIKNVSIVPNTPPIVPNTPIGSVSRTRSGSPNQTEFRIGYHCSEHYQDYATWDTSSRFCVREVFDECPCEENRENGNKVNGHYMYWQKERCRSCLFYLTKSIWVIKLCEVAIDSCFVG